MTDREKLVELINHVCEGHIENLMQPYGVETLADYLLANGVTVQEWIPVIERLPKDNLPVLVYESKYSEIYGNMQTAYYNHKRWMGCIGENVTHWMSLPKAPKEEDHNAGD